MVVEYVGVRAVTQVVTQAGNRHIADVFFPDIQFRLFLLKFPHHLLRYVARADAMFEPVMGRSGKHVVNTTQLFEVASPLELLSVYYVPTNID